MVRGRFFVVTVALCALYACGGTDALPEGPDGGGRDVRILVIDASVVEDAWAVKEQLAEVGGDALAIAPDLVPAVDAATPSPDLAPAVDAALPSPDMTQVVDAAPSSPDLALVGDAGCGGPEGGPSSCPPVTVAQCAISGPVPKVTLKNNTLTLLFDDASNKIRLTTSTDGFLQLVDFSSDDIDPYKVTGDLLLVNGQPIDTTTLDVLQIIFCDGDDQLLEPIFSVPELRIYGGAGDDVIKIPAGRGVAYVYLGPGDDHVNAEHHQTNWLYGEDGSDSLAGSSDGANYLFGGRGSNRLITNEHILPPSNNHTTRDTTVYRQGASETWMDMRADNDYVFVSDGSGSAGRVTIIDHGGDDLLDFSRWEHPVTIDPQLIGASQIVSRAPDGTPLLTLHIMMGTFERVVLP